MEENMKEEKKSIYGLLSLALGIIAVLVMLWTNSGRFNIINTTNVVIASILLGKMGLKNEKERIKSILGIIFSIIAIVIYIFGIVTTVNEQYNQLKDKINSWDLNEYITDLKLEDLSETDVISGNNWTGRDGSYLMLNNFGRFKFYKDKNDLKDNYYEGHYEVYNGNNAIDYIANSLSRYGVTEEEQKGIIERNQKYSINNYYCIVLNNSKYVVNGQDTFNGTTVMTPYFGFYNESTNMLEMANMNAGSYVYFTKD